MNFRTSPFRSDCLKLSFYDIFRLLIGKIVVDGALKVGLWRMPRNE